LDGELQASPFTLSDAQLTLGREYGFANWPRLREAVAESMGVELQLPHHERIEDATFRQAVDLVDEGNIDKLRQLLADNLALIEETVTFEGGNYFSNPTLLEFIAENPIRNNSLPKNIVEVTRFLLESGADQNQHSVGMTLSLVCSGNVVREQGVQLELVDLLCQYGADPTGAMMPALSHGEFEAAKRLIERGANLDIVSAAAIGQHCIVESELASASADERHQALAMASQHGRESALRLLLESGEDPSRFNPVGFHAHSTPLHQAALAGNLAIVKLLIEFGADTTLKDTIFDGSPVGWARHAGHEKIAKFIEAKSN
jgi:ankyrin repeat protein